MEQQLEGSQENVAALSESVEQLQQQLMEHQARSQQWQSEADTFQVDLLGRLERKDQEHADLTADLDKELKAKERLSDEVRRA